MIAKKRMGGLNVIGLTKMDEIPVLLNTIFFSSKHSVKNFQKLKTVGAVFIALQQMPSQTVIVPIEANFP